MILVAGLTPAWQQILIFDQVRLGEVNRAQRVFCCGSGKVLNVAIGLDHLQADAKTVCLVGGQTGEALQVELKDLPVRWVPSREPTRVCTTLLDQAHNETTELVENARSISSAEVESFLAMLREEAPKADWLILTGSLPPAAPSDFYRRAVKGFVGKAIIDARGPELLESLASRPFLIKPNREELARTVGRSLDAQSDVIAAMHELNQRGAEWVLVTDGAEPVVVTHEGQHWVYPSHSVEVVNPIGCGDCLTAGLADALQRGQPLPEAIRWGIACAADNLSQLLPARLDRQRIQNLYARAE